MRVWTSSEQQRVHQSAQASTTLRYTSSNGDRQTCTSCTPIAEPASCIMQRRFDTCDVFDTCSSPAESRIGTHVEIVQKGQDLILVFLRDHECEANAAAAALLLCGNALVAQRIHQTSLAEVPPDRLGQVGPHDNGLATSCWGADLLLHKSFEVTGALFQRLICL